MRQEHLDEVLRECLEATQFLHNGRILEEADQQTIRAALSCYFALIFYVCRLNWKELSRLVRDFPKSTERIKSDTELVSDFVRDGKGELPAWVLRCSALRQYIESCKRPINAKNVHRLKNAYTIGEFLQHLTLQAPISDADGVTELGRFSERGTYRPIHSRIADILNHWYPQKNISGYCQVSGGASNGCPRSIGSGYKYWTMIHSIRSASLCSMLGEPVDHLVQNRIPTSRLFAVPKGITKPRWITIEDTSQNFVQKGVRSALDVITSTTDTPVIIGVDDQTASQSLALRSSYSEVYATIDFSNASDSIKVNYLNEWNLRPYIVRARSPYVSFDNEVVYSETYGGMGNAVTFAVLRWFIAALVAAACEDSGVATSGIVFGDDAIVPCSAVNQFLLLAEQAGLVVNDQKSFWNGDFREACGMHAIMGNDITPLRIPRGFSFPKRPNSSEFSSWISFVNHCQDFSTDLGRFVMRQCPQVVKDNTVFASEGEGVLHSNGVHLNRQLQYRYNRKFHRGEYQVLSEIARQSTICDEIRYWMVLRELAQTKRTKLMDPDDRIEICGGPIQQELRRLWVPSSDLI